MIIDHDETTRTGVISLMKRGDESTVEKTLALPVISAGGDEDETIEPTEPPTREPLPPLDPPWVVRPVKAIAVLPLAKSVGVEQADANLSKVAARIQSLHSDVVVWYGQHTKEFWVMDSVGLHSFADVTALYQGMGWQSL